MAGHILELRGCTPEPLGNYLKGLGVFRLIAEQADPQARAWWKDGVLLLHTKWSWDEVVSFFLRGIGEKKTPIYSPTPIFAPWGGRPGFYKDSHKRAKAILDKIRKFNDPNSRFAAACRTVTLIDELLRTKTAVVTEKRKEVRKAWVDLIKKNSPKIDQRTPLKNEISGTMRSNWCEAAVDWFDACLALEDDVRFGFLFGSGGNEGNADITNNFWEMIEEVVGLPTPKSQSAQFLARCIIGEGHLGEGSRTVGQHFPLAAGSANCGQDYEGSSSTNPWDFVLMMEGAILFAGATTKRLSQFGKGKAAFPFMIDHLATEEASTSNKDELKQDAKVIRCRAEFWMPLWNSAISFPELQSLLSEGRLQRHSGKRTDHTLHAMEAVKTLGVARGIDAFHRVALFERRGQGSYLASSLGYHSTAQALDSLAPQLAEIEDFRQRVYSKLREGPGIPDRVMRARQSLHTALATLLTRDEHRSISVGETLVDVLTRVAGVEREVSLLKDREKLLNPCPPLSRKWMRDDANDADLRLARAIAGIAAWGESSDPKRSAVEAIRSNLLPVSRSNRHSKLWNWDATSRSAVWSRGASLTTNFIAVLRRRLIDAQRGSGEGLPLWSSHGASYADLLTYWKGDIDEGRLAELIHGFALVDSGRWNQDDINDWQQQRQERCETPDIDTSQIYFVDEVPRGKLRVPTWLKTDFDSACELPRVYHLLKLCFVGGRLPRRPVERESVRRTGKEPFVPKCLDVLSLLEAGRLAEGVQLAARRLRGKGYPTVLVDSFLDRQMRQANRSTNAEALRMTPEHCQRLAGMMLIPVRHPGVSAALAIKPESTNS